MEIFIETLGITGGLILVMGSLFREKPKASSHHSRKTWIFLFGSLFLLPYSLLGTIFLQNSPFFIIIQIYMLLALLFNFFRVKRTQSNILLSVIGFGLFLSAVWFDVFTKSTDILSLLGFILLAFGYSWPHTTKSNIIKRNLFLGLGSLDITVFSFYEASWVFFWFNIFFAIFSFWNIYTTIQKS